MCDGVWGIFLQVAATNRPNNMNGGIPSQGWLNAGNIPFDLKVKIGQHVEPYTIVPLLDGEVSGSGTLVTIDGVRGILTAAHVVRHWHKDQRSKRLGIVSGHGASALIEEPLVHFDHFETEPGDPADFGPDLAFVRIPSPSGFLATLNAKKSFYDLTASGVPDRIVFITRTGPMASFGVVAEKTERSNGQTTINSTVFLVTEPQSFEREGYDYLDVRSRRSLEPKTPNSFGGTSGSGLWRFSIAKLSESEIEPYDFHLAGVAFYQLGDTSDGVATVRFHGPRSIYEQFLPKVRNWLGW
jgi:hypothetical protein